MRAHGPVLAKSPDMLTTASFMNRKVVVLNQDTPAQIAAKAMRENGIGCIFLKDAHGRLSGIVTDRDFACRWGADYNGADVSVSKIMTSEILKANEGAGLNDIIGLMETYGLRRIPIVAKAPDGTERIIGLVTLDDLIASGEVPPSRLARIVRTQIGRRISLRQQRPIVNTQSLDRFYASISQITGIKPSQVPPITHYLLSVLMMRVTTTAAEHFIAQLPKPLQSSLRGLPPGPDRGVSLSSVIVDLSQHYDVAPEQAEPLLQRFLSGLKDVIDPHLVEHLRSHLPLEFQAFFEPSKSREQSAA